MPSLKGTKGTERKAGADDNQVEMQSWCRLFNEELEIRVLCEISCLSRRKIVKPWISQIDVSVTSSLTYRLLWSSAPR